MLYRVGDMIQLGDIFHMDNSNLPYEFAGEIVKICEVNPNKYWFYAEHSELIGVQKWYVYHGDCKLHISYDMPDKNELLEFITGE